MSKQLCSKCGGIGLIPDRRSASGYRHCLCWQAQGHEPSSASAQAAVEPQGDVAELVKEARAYDAKNAVSCYCARLADALERSDAARQQAHAEGYAEAIEASAKIACDNDVNYTAACIRKLAPQQRGAKEGENG